LHAAAANHGCDRAFDQLTPSLRRFITSTSDDMIECADVQIAWRLPLGVDMPAMVNDLIAWSANHLGAVPPSCDPLAVVAGTPVTLTGHRTSFELRFKGAEMPWRGDRQNGLVRSFLRAIRAVDQSVQPGFLVKTGTSDMNVVGPVWHCPIVAYGPGDSALDHTPHEHLSLDEYWRAINVLESAIRHFGETGP
jgi:LysW-gamma-L-lysine carboxypeptidase